MIISAPAFCVRLIIALIFDFGRSSVKGMPLTEVWAGRGTIASPWPPRTMPWMSSTEMFNVVAIKLLYLEESRMPAMPITLFLGSFVDFKAW